ncbi:3-deoxy-D-manno-octulosonic acid transferase [Roseobacteraceae bacterium S113]
MFVYRLLLALIAPLFALWALSKVLRGQEGWRDAGERLGLVMCRTRGPSLWLHAASNGELASAASVVRLLRAADPQLHIVVTTNSVTGRALAQSWGLEQVHAQLAPFDARWCAARLIARTGLVGLVIMEAEFWPNRIAAIAKAGLPVVILGARLSRKSAKGWRRMSFLAEPVLSRISWLVPQDHGSARRLRKLGLAGERIDRVTNLKALYAPPGAAQRGCLARGLPARGHVARSVNP